MTEPFEQIRYIEWFLEDLSQTPRQLSDILQETGMSEQELSQFRSKHMESYVSELLLRWHALLPTLLHSERRADILLRRYGLSGLPNPTLQELGNEYGISRERVRQVQQGALERLRAPQNKQAVEQAAAEAAQEILKRAPLP
jgi:DNA-directed RNA polymerase sigma subunit (sigma70/sigma32)